MVLYSTNRGCFSAALLPDEMSIDESCERLFEKIKSRNQNEFEFQQAVHETMEHLKPVFNKDRRYLKVFEILCEPERVLMFRVPWITDSGEVRINRGYRVQFNSAIGPYKGGLRFHPSVNLSVLKFLGFEQTLKNSLTGLPLGGAKGGSDFDPKGKSETEIRSFCQAFMGELHSHIGPQVDVPAGDIGVGEREIGFLFGQYKKLNRAFEGSLTGKNPNWGGSLIRPEATGYGAVYFTRELLADLGETDMSNLNCVVSGSGNAAQYTAEKCLQLGVKVLTMSDSNGCIVARHGLTNTQLTKIMKVKSDKSARLRDIDFSSEESEVVYIENGTPWSCDIGDEKLIDIAFPAATQNEINEKDVCRLYAKKCRFIMEVSNMALTEEAIAKCKELGIRFGPSKAVNAGGVAVSALEMSQNATGIFWSRDEVDRKLLDIMATIYQRCKQAARDFDHEGDLAIGADIAGFIKVADSIVAEGAV